MEYLIRCEATYLEICDFFAKYDAEFSNHYDKTINHCSSKIQNQTLGIAADCAVDKIAAEVRIVLSTQLW